MNEMSVLCRPHDASGQLRAVYRRDGESHTGGAGRNESLPGCCFRDRSDEGAAEMLKLTDSQTH